MPVVPTTLDIPYGPYIHTRFDWYQANTTPPYVVPPMGKPWILICPIDGFRGGGKLSVQTPDRSWYNFIKFFVDDRALNSLDTPFDVFVADGGCYLPGTEPDPFNQNRSFKVYAPENCYQFARCFQTIRTIIRDQPERFPNLDPDAGGYGGFSSGGTAAMVCAYTEPSIIHSRGVSGPYHNQWRMNESSRPAFLVNWSGGNDYRVNANVNNNSNYIFGTVDGVQHSQSLPSDLLNAISGITLVNASCPPTINIYDDPAAESRPLTQPHNQTQGLELEAALDAVGVYNEFYTKSIAGGFVDSLSTSIDLPRIYTFIVGSNVLNLE